MRLHMGSAGGLKKKMELRSGSHAIDISYGSPVQEPRRGHPFYGFSEKPPNFSRLLRRTWGYGGPFIIFNHLDPTGVSCFQVVR